MKQGLGPIESIYYLSKTLQSTFLLFLILIYILLLDYSDLTRGYLLYFALKDATIASESLDFFTYFYQSMIVQLSRFLYLLSRSLQRAAVGKTCLWIFLAIRIPNGWQMKAEMLWVSLDCIIQKVNMRGETFILFLNRYRLLLQLINLLLIVLMSPHIIINLSLDILDLRLIFDNFSLRISHYLVSLYFLTSPVYFVLNRLTEFFEKVQTLMDKLIFSFVQA